MKNNKLMVYIFPFLLGAIVSGLVVGLVMYSLRPQMETITKGIREISLDSARIYHQDYLRKKPMVVDTLRSFTLNLEQLNTFNILLQKNPKVTRFRIYPGLVGDPTDVAIVFGLDDSGGDNSSTPIYLVQKGTSGPCPPTCDRGTPLD
jgi:hypothetical protein